MPVGNLPERSGGTRRLDKGRLPADDGEAQARAAQAEWPEHWPAMPLPAMSDDQWPTMILPPLGSDQWPTMILPALTFDPASQQKTDYLRAVPLVYGATPEEDLPIDQLQTWVLPVIAAHTPARAGQKKSRALFAGAEGYITLIRNLATTSGIYALAALGAPLISLVLAPFLTHYLSPADYGALAILNTLIGLGAGITQLGLGSAFFRAYSTDFTSARDRRAVLASVTVLLLVVATPMALLTVLAAPLLARLLFGTSSLSGPLLLAAGVVLLQNLTVPGFAWLRAENRPFFFSTLSLANLLIGLVANLVLVGVLRLGVAGSLLATGSGYLAVVLCTMPLIVARTGLRLRGDVARSLLAFGVPLVLSFVSYWILQLSDRYLLTIFGSLAQTASYAVAYSLGSVLSTAVIAPFSLAWPTAMYTIAKRKDAPQIFRIVFRWFSMLLFFGAFALSLVATLILDLLFPPSYRSAAPVIPIVAASIALYGIYILFMTGANVRRKTWLTAVFTTAAALANVGFNLLLIPRLGATGAAISTLIAYALLAAITYLANQRIYPIPFEIGRLVGAVGVGAAIYLTAAKLALAWDGRWGWQISLAGLVLYGAWLIVLSRGGGLRPRGSARVATAAGDG